MKHHKLRLFFIFNILSLNIFNANYSKAGIAFPAYSGSAVIVFTNSAAQELIKTDQRLIINMTSDSSDTNMLDDDSINDDDDAGFSLRERLFPDVSVCTDFLPCNHDPHHFCDTAQSKFYHSRFYYVAHRSFISLRVFRL